LAVAGEDALGHAVLSRALRRGAGTANDAGKAAERAKKSADTGSLFGLCLLEGIGIAADEVAGARMCQRSAEGGCVWGLLAFGFCPANGRRFEKAEAEAVNFNRLADVPGGRSVG
jgi:hypothetical protein